MVEEPGQGERVGHIQAEIAHTGSQAGEPLQLVRIAHQIAVGTGAQQGLQAPGLIGPGDAGPGQPQPSRPAALADRHRLAQLAWLVQIGYHAVQGQIAQCPQLRQIAHQHHQ